MAFDLRTVMDNQVIPSLHRNEEQHSARETEQVNRENTLADINDKIQGLREKKYDFAEKQQRRGLRDEQAAAGLEKAKNEGYRYDKDTDDRKALEATNLADLAQRSGNEGAWKMATKMLSEADENYGTILEQAPPELRPQILAGIREKHSLNLETARKGIELGMQGDQQVRVQQEKGSQDRQTQAPRLASLEGRTNAQIQSQEDINERRLELQRQVAGMGTGVNFMLSRIEQQYGTEEANKLRVEYINSLSEKNRTAGRGGKTPTQLAAEKDKYVEDSLNTSIKTLLSSASDMPDGWFDDNDNLMDIETLQNKPGVREMYKYISDHAGAGVVNRVGERFVFSDSLGIVGLPLYDSDGGLKGGVTAKQLEDTARRNGWSMIKTLKKHRQRLVDHGVLRDASEWPLGE